MKLAEIYDNHLHESLDKPLPYIKINANRYKIELSITESIEVYIYEKTIQRYDCVSVVFLNPNDDKVQLTNFFNGPEAIRVLSTIIDIFKTIEFDILVMIPDDIIVKVENRKNRLYNTVLFRMLRLGRICGRESISYPEFSKPVLVGLHRDGCSLSTDEIAMIVKRFGIDKFENSTTKGKIKCNY